MTCVATSFTNAANAEQLKVIEDERIIIVRQNGVDVLTYNKVSPPAPDGIEAVYERSGCLHPVGSPQGTVVTAMFPFDHAHQHGIFSAWVNTTYNGQVVDFWNLAGGTGKVFHERVVSTFETFDPLNAHASTQRNRTSVSHLVSMMLSSWILSTHFIADTAS